MRKEKVKTIAATLTSLGALLFLYVAVYGTAPKVDPRPHLALGQALAEEAGKLLGNGGRITVIARSTDVFQNPAADIQMKGFYRSIKKAKLPLAATNVVSLNPITLVRVPPGNAYEVLRKQSEGDVVVSFLGPPVVSREQWPKLAKAQPRIVAVCSGAMPWQMNLKELFDQNLLHVAVISRPSPAARAPKSGVLRIWFDHFYQVITPANLSDLPLPPDSRPR
jgi:hypothetical protein